MNEKTIRISAVTNEFKQRAEAAELRAVTLAATLDEMAGQIERLEAQLKAMQQSEGEPGDK